MRQAVGSLKHEQWKDRTQLAADSNQRQGVEMSDGWHERQIAVQETPRVGTASIDRTAGPCGKTAAGTHGKLAAKT